VGGWSIARTASLPILRELCSGGVIRAARERQAGAALVADFGVVAETADQQVEALSGGNQQKVVVGRWLRGRPTVMLLDEPFRGVDIGARRDLSRRMRDVAAAGAAVLVMSADVDEILEVADRILVLVNGAMRMDSYASETTRDRIVTAMAEVA
jgi:simple sugar transport system ATP-binding protein